MAQLTWTMHAKILWRFRVFMFLLKILACIRLIDLETAARSICFVARKGWVSKYKVGGGKWKKLEMNLEYEIIDTSPPGLTGRANR